jgi:hypothetical protein
MISFDQAKQRWRVDIDRQIDGRRQRVAKYLPASATEEDARALSAQIERSFIHSMKVPANNEWDRYVDDMVGRKSWLDEALAKCRHRSSLKGRACMIDREFIADRLRLTRGRCELTGLRFSTDRADVANRPYAHSIDRIDSTLGYTRSNVRIVCAGINVAMMHWGEALFAKLAVGYVFHQFGFAADMERENLSQNLTTSKIGK